MVGYSIAYLLEHSQTTRIVGRDFIRHSAGAEDVVIRVPVAVPYQNDWDAPQPAEGQIEHEGKFYQMKSMQLLSDTLIVHCEYDQGTRERFSALASKINDQITGTNSLPEKGPHTVILKKFLKEYMARDHRHVFYVFEWTVSRNPNFPPVCFALSEANTTIPLPPPDLA